MKAKSKKIRSFLGHYKNESTKYAYRSHLRRFFKTIDVDNPDEYFQMDKDFNEDIINFAKSLQDSPAKTFTSAMAVVKKFMIRNDADLKKYIWDDARNFRTGTRAVTIDQAPTPQKLSEILHHADLKIKAMALILSSSGMRVGEVTQIKLNDIDFDSEPVKINVRAEYTKSGNPRFTFISDEASECLKEWLKQREGWLEKSVKSINFNSVKTEKKKNDNRVFPFTAHYGRELWNRALENSGYNKRDPKTNFYLMHVHTLRKYFMSNMKLKVPNVVVEALSGHSAYLDEAYRRYSEQQLKEEYLKGVNALSVYQRTPDLEEFEEKMEEKDKQLNTLNETMDRMQMKIDIMENKLDIEKQKNGEK